MSEVALQLNFFGPPEPIDSYSKRRGRCDDAPVACERENLWPSDLAQILGRELLEKLYGDIPRRTRLYVKEVCRRMRCDSNHIYELIQVGSLDATDIGSPDASRAEWRVYRYSLVSFFFNREFRDGATRADLSDSELDRIETAVSARRKNLNRTTQGKSWIR